MNEDLKKIQNKLIKSLERLDTQTDKLEVEVSRCNAISQLANTYVKTCNLVIRIEDSKNNLKNKVEKALNNEK